AEQIVAFDHIRISLFDGGGQALQRVVFRFLHIFGIDNEQFFPTGVVREGNAHDMIAPAGVTDSGYRKHFYLHPFQFFKRQVFKQRASGRGEVVLYRIGEGEEIASSVLQTVTQADEFLPAIDRDQPTVIEIALKLFGFDAKIDNIRVAPDKWVKRLNIGNGQSICFPTINLNRSSFAEFNCDNAMRRMGFEVYAVLLEFHFLNKLLSFRAKSRNLLLFLRTELD